MDILRLDNLACLEEVCFCMCFIVWLILSRCQWIFLEEQVSEERYPDLNEEADIRMEDSRDENCRDVAEEGENNKKIHALR